MPFEPNKNAEYRYNSKKIKRFIFFFTYKMNIAKDTERKEIEKTQN